MEVSIKAPIVQAAVAIGGFMAYLAEVGAERDDSEQTKTRWALGYYADKLKSAPAASAKAPLAGKSAATAAAARPTPARRAPAKKSAAARDVAVQVPVPGARRRATAPPTRKAAPARTR
jgi:hypothetical protein